MSPQSPLQIGQECFLTALDRTLVVEILGISGETIWVTYPMADTIKEGTPAELSFHIDSGFIGFHTRVTSAPKPNQQGIMLERTEAAEYAKARRHWRVATDLMISIKDSEDAPYTEAQVCDLSIDGALISTAAELDAGSMLEMLFQLPHEDPHVISLQVVYCAPGSGSELHRYGLRFVELNEAAHDAMMMYLYLKIKETYPQQLRDLYPRPSAKH